ncbi:MAG: geranylgeranylglycerol-phosphate geranylgeranyltransferase [Candidatus Bathyarchaeota archaeon]|nr:geranylgeranylglycerol-phosphate geranylgeranyltransferase [Candidatus Bathyarchaeota archaeon]
MRKIQGFLRLIRPLNCLMMGIATLIGVLLAGQKFLNVNDLLIVSPLSFMTAFTLTGASMAINDYYDREIDEINEPERPIPSGVVSPNEALIVSACLILLGLTSAYLTTFLCLIVGLISLIIFLTYSTIGKRTGLYGNFLVSACVAFPFIYGSLAISNEIRLNAIIFSALAFLSNTGREITKGIVDMQGDRSKNIKTIAVKYGASVAAYAASTFYIFAVILSILPWILKQVSSLYIPPIIMTNIGFVLISILLIRDNSRSGARKVKNLALIWMFMGLLSFLSGIFG